MKRYTYKGIQEIVEEREHEESKRHLIVYLELVATIGMILCLLFFASVVFGGCALCSGGQVFDRYRHGCFDAYDPPVRYETDHIVVRWADGIEGPDAETFSNALRYADEAYADLSIKVKPGSIVKWLRGFNVVFVEGSFLCESPSGEAHCIGEYWYDNRLIILTMFDPALARTALYHELGHIASEMIWKDSDGDHSRQDFWVYADEMMHKRYVLKGSE